MRRMTGPQRGQPAAQKATQKATQQATQQAAAKVSRRGAAKKRRSLADDISPLLLSVEEAAIKIRISRAQMYRIIARGEIETRKVGYLRRINLSALEAYIAALPRQGRSEW